VTHPDIFVDICHFLCYNAREALLLDIKERKLGFFMSDSYNGEKKNSGIGIASMVCGIAALCCCNPLSLCSISAVVCGIIALNKKDTAKVMPIIGIALGGLCILLDILAIPMHMGIGFVI
jgi:hypothetical protein